MADKEIVVRASYVKIKMGDAEVIVYDEKEAPLVDVEELASSIFKEMIGLTKRRI